MIIFTATEYWEACQEYHKNGSKVLLGTLQFLEKNEIIKKRLDVIFTSLDKENKIEAN